MFPRMVLQFIIGALMLGFAAAAPVPAAPAASPAPAAKPKTWWQKFSGILSGIFGKAPSTLQRLSGAVKALAPLANLVISFVDPEYLKEAQGIEAEIQSDASALLGFVTDAHTDPSAGKMAQVTAAANSLSANFGSLAALAHIKDAKLQALVSTGLQELNVVIPMLAQAGSGNAASA